MRCLECSKEAVKVVLYGTGKSSLYFYNLIKLNNEIEIVAVVDGNLSKRGELYDGYSILSPSDLKDMNYDFILIASVYYNEIKDILVNEIGIDSNKIVADNDVFVQNLWVEKEYSKHYRKQAKELHNPISALDKIVIYTAMFGGYDNLTDPEYTDQNCDYICFTDSINVKSDKWKIVYISKEYTDPNRAAKEYKILPHKFLDEYQWSIWVDANYTITGSMRELLNQSVGKSHMAFLIHTERNCIYDEAEECIRGKRDNEQLIREQMELYKGEGYPEKNGLLCGSCIIRQHNEPTVKKLMERWWNEICKGSRRDQLSFNYSVWKENLFYDVMSIHTYVNPYFRISKHLQ